MLASIRTAIPIGTKAASKGSDHFEAVRGIAESGEDNKGSGPFAQVAEVGSILAKVKERPKRVSDARSSGTYSNH